MKKYLQKTLQDAFLIWLFLEIGIIISAILYAILKVEGVSDNTGLLVAFITLVGLIVLGLALFPTNSSGLTQSLKKWLSGEQKPSKQLESLVVQQNMLLEKLNQSLDYLALSSAVSSIPELSPKQGQSSTKSTLKFDYDRLVSSHLSETESLVRVLNSGFRDSMIEQRNIVTRLEQNQQREQEMVEQLSFNMANQQANLAQVVQSLTIQQKTLEQLIQHLEEQRASEEKGKVNVLFSQTGTGKTRSDQEIMKKLAHISPQDIQFFEWPSESSPLKEPKQIEQQESKTALLEQERHELAIERERLEILEKPIDVQKKGIEYALEIATKTVAVLHPDADEQTKAMLIQTLLPNLLQLQNSKGIVLVLPEPHNNEEKTVRPENE